MDSHRAAKVALLYPGDRADRDKLGDRADPAESRFAALFQAFAAAGIAAEPAVYQIGRASCRERVYSSV